MKSTDDQDSDDDLIVVGISTAADRANAARQNAVDLISDHGTPHRHLATSAVPTDNPPVTVTEKLLAEKIQQLACSKNFVDM